MNKFWKRVKIFFKLQSLYWERMGLYNDAILGLSVDWCRVHKIEKELEELEN